jgi:hypothetical protein
MPIDPSTDQSFTVSAWVKLTNKDGNLRTVMGQDAAAASVFGLEYEPVGHKWRIRVPVSAGQATEKSVVSTAEAAQDTWTHLTAVYDASTKTLRLYVNGVDQGNAIVVAQLLHRDMLDLDAEQLDHRDIFGAGYLPEGTNRRGNFVPSQERSQGPCTGHRIRIGVMLNQNEEIVHLLERFPQALHFLMRAGVSQLRL